MFCIGITVYGCGKDVQTVTPEELQALNHRYQEPKLSTWYYMGSAAGYHYFTHLDLPRESRFRVGESQLKWKKSAAYSNDRTKWVQLPWGVHDPGFFQSTNYLRTAP
jgi:hypothetical protein